PRQAGQSGGASSPAPVRVVVIEDEPTITRAIADRLTAEGWEVSTALDGPSGVRTVTDVRPDLVVLDVMLPGFDGLEVCRRIQAEDPVPVLMLTARDDETDMLVGLGVGADDYMSKPFSMRELSPGSRLCCAGFGAHPPRPAPPTGRIRRWPCRSGIW